MQDTAMLTFVMSHACPLKCDFCCSTRGVVGKGRITRAMLLDALTRFGREPVVRRFAFSGGDPFLFLADIKHAMAAARAAGIRQPFHVVTSAYWVESPAQVRKILEDLRDLGLDKIGLSYDREHARWVSLQQIEIVCDAACDLSMAVNVIGTFWDARDRIETLWPSLA